MNADRSDRLDGDDRDHPDLQAAGRAGRGRRAAAGGRAPRARHRHARGLRRPGGVPRLERRAPGSAGRRSGSAAIGSVSTRIPAEIVTELRDGGWDADAIAAIWQTRFAAHAQPFGVRLPKLEIRMSDRPRRRARHRRTHARAGAAATASRTRGRRRSSTRRRSIFGRTSRARTPSRSPTTTARARWRR